jgi:hypothetical protein
MEKPFAGQEATHDYVVEAPLGRQRVMWVIWPAFLVAAVLEMVVFALVDPQDLHWFGGAALDWSREAIYTAAFFFFWVMAAISGGITTLLSLPPSEVNRRT